MKLKDNIFSLYCTQNQGVQKVMSILIVPIMYH